MNISAFMQEEFGCKLAKIKSSSLWQGEEKNQSGQSNLLAPTSLSQNRIRTLEYSSYDIGSYSPLLVHYCNGQIAAYWIYICTYTSDSTVNIYTGLTPLTTVRILCFRGIFKIPQKPDTKDALVTCPRNGLH